MAVTEADRKTLRQVIEEARDPNLLIVRDKNAPAYVAVTTEAAKKLVEQFIDRRTQTASAIPDSMPCHGRFYWRFACGQRAEDKLSLYVAAVQV